MSFLLDTNICIYYLNGDQGLVKRILALGPEPLAISTLSLAELHFGAARSARPEANRERIALFVGELSTVDFDDACAEHFGRIKASLAVLGQPIPDFDVAITATAFTRGWVLVSNDRHMRRIPGLALEDWTVSSQSS